MRGDHSLETAFELGYIKGCRCTRGRGKQVQEAVEVMQTSAGHGADPSTTKRDLYAALQNPENVTKTCSAVKPQKFSTNTPKCLLHA